MAALCYVYVNDAFGTAHRAGPPPMAGALRSVALRPTAAGGRLEALRQPGTAEAPAGGHRRRLQGCRPS